MDELIIRSLMAETTAEEERQLMRWRAAAPENAARYRSLSATWELAGQAWTPSDRKPPSAQSLIERAEERDRQTADWGDSRDSKRLGPHRSVVRAVLAAAALAGVLIAGALLRPMTSPDAGAEAPYTVVAEEARTVYLADGSTVYMAGGSTLDIDPANPRSVWLDGRAYFGISSDPDRPFVVGSAAGQTRVLGTRFDLTARGDELTVVVVEGRVEVVSDSGDAEVGPGQQSRIVAGGQPVVEPADVETTRHWLGNVFIFQSTPLAVVVRELEERFDRHIYIDDPDLEDRTVTAVFADRSLDQILPALCRAVGATCVASSGAVHFTP